MTTAERAPPVQLKEGEQDKYDPTKIGDMIEKIKKERLEALEGVITDRQIKVINTMSSASQSSLKNLLFKIDQDEISRMKSLNMNEEKMDQATGNMAAMKFLA